MKTVEQVRDALRDPLEEVFNLEQHDVVEQQTGIIPYQPRQTELVVHEQYDNKDTEVEHQFEEVYNKALDAYELQVADIEFVEGKYKARVGEVAAQFLNTALAAAREKRMLKEHKDKLNIEAMKASKPGTVNQNLIVADRNEILKALMEQRDGTSIIEHS